MAKEEIEKTSPVMKEYKVLVAVDFSPCSAHALKRSKRILGRKPDRIFVLHVKE